MRRVLSLILSTSAPRWFRMRVWIPMLLALLALASVLTETDDSGWLGSSTAYTSEQGGYSLHVRARKVTTALGTARRVRVEWTLDNPSPSVMDHFAAARSRATGDVLWLLRTNLWPTSTQGWGTSPFTASSGTLIASIPPVAEALARWLLVPALLAALVIAMLRTAERPLLPPRPDLLAQGLCPNCQYALGVGGLLVCPECGTAFPTPRPSPVDTPATPPTPATLAAPPTIPPSPSIPT